jgi:uncharacterized protein (UPF0335 family)
MNPYPEVSPRTIWNFQQNNPELVVKDAKEYLNLNDEQCELLRTILLARGVNKWLKVRRDLIAYKKQLKHELKSVGKEAYEIKQQMKANGYDEKLYRQYLVDKELHKKLMKIRGDLKALCMTDRWQIWPKSTSHHVLKMMNSIKCAD